MVARVLDPKALRLGWAQLGFNGEITQQIKSVIVQPSGLFLITGPTGSGKTTTLYTALSHLNRDDRKILTTEDPVEYNLHGIYPFFSAPELVFFGVINAIKGAVSKRDRSNVGEFRRSLTSLNVVLVQKQIPILAGNGKLNALMG
ncbi:hypothetical protein GO984_23225 [Rhodobacteraceae bacterium CY05]|uniref:Bacterial type II secretion system protein E domain-containing protein n=1 Tax=Parasedimentitalea huanghaiensis TaxID=2682100 RepID=A0A6L6WLJ1_9RHOB|nr:hypothetical protein [Zongyanglinia huanghaiensis]